MQNAHRQEAPGAALEIDVELFGLDLAGPARDDIEQRDAVGGDDVGELQAARAELREIVVEPARERGVQ